MPRFPLNQIAEYVIGNPGADTANRSVRQFHRLVKHQSHLVVKARRGGTNIQRGAIHIGPVQKRPFQSLLQSPGIQVTGTDSAAIAGGQHCAGVVHDKQLRCIHPALKLLWQ